MKSTRTVTFTLIWTAVHVQSACLLYTYRMCIHTQIYIYGRTYIMPLSPHHPKKWCARKNSKLVSSGESTWHGLNRKNQTSWKNTHFLARLIIILFKIVMWVTTYILLMSIHVTFLVTSVHAAFRSTLKAGRTVPVVFC